MNEDAIYIGVAILALGIAVYLVFGLDSGSGSGSGNALVDAMVEGITQAENSNPAWNNPGDLTESFGFPTTGTANSAGVLIFATAAGGLSALQAQVTAIANGTSRYSTGSVSDLAVGYTGGDNAAGWAATVAAAMGISIDTNLSDYFSGSAGGSQVADNAVPSDDSDDDSSDDSDDEDDSYDEDDSSDYAS